MLTPSTMSRSLLMLFLSLVVCCSYASKDIVLTLAKDDKVVKEYAEKLFKEKNACAWLH